MHITGGFAVIDAQQRRLDDRVCSLGFASLGSYLAARTQADASSVQLASELATTIEVVGRLLDQMGIRRAAPKARSAGQRRRVTDQRLHACAARLGFADLQGYLADRVVVQAWSLAQVAGELGVNVKTVRDRLDRLGLRRSRHTPAQRDGSRRAAARIRARAKARRTARLAELGFANLEAYLRVRRVQQGWPIPRLRAELGVDRAWLTRQLAQLGLR